MSQPISVQDNSLTVDVVLYDKIFLPLHHQNTDRDDTPTRGKTIFYVHEKNLPRVGAKKPSE